VTGLSLTSLEDEKAELHKDLVAFKTSYDTIRQRLLQGSESHPQRGAALEKWSGTWACVGALELSITTLERQVLEVENHIQQVRAGEIPNTDPPPKQGLGIIHGGRHE